MCAVTIGGTQRPERVEPAVRDPCSVRHWGGPWATGIDVGGARQPWTLFRNSASRLSDGSSYYASAWESGKARMDLRIGARRLRSSEEADRGPAGAKSSVSPHERLPPMSGDGRMGEGPACIPTRRFGAKVAGRFGLRRVDKNWIASEVRIWRFFCFPTVAAFVQVCTQ